MNQQARASIALIIRRGVPSLLASLLFLALASAGCKKKEGGENKGGSQTSRSALPQAKIQTRIQAENKLEISVTVPHAHHAYLDKGKEGNYIQISFDWKALQDAGALKGAPRMIQKPKGEYDKLAKATVLRGKGAYVFQSQEAWPRGKTLKVKSQVCNETKGVCYPPHTEKVVLK